MSSSEVEGGGYSRSRRALGNKDTRLGHWEQIEEIPAAAVTSRSGVGGVEGMKESQREEHDKPHNYFGNLCCLGAGLTNNGTCCVYLCYVC